MREVTKTALKAQRAVAILDDVDAGRMAQFLAETARKRKKTKEFSCLKIRFIHFEDWKEKQRPATLSAQAEERAGCPKDPPLKETGRAGALDLSGLVNELEDRRTSQ